VIDPVSAVLELVTVAVNVTLAPTTLGFKLEVSEIEVGFTLSTLPLRLITVGVSAALELIVSVPYTGVPVTVGANSTPRLHCTSMARVAPAWQVVVAGSSAELFSTAKLVLENSRLPLPSFS
jgi:hypothetical protein